MKRSSHVALLLMGATGVGASAYAMTPRNCPPPGSPPAAVAPAPPKAADLEQCRPRRSWGGSSGWTRTNSSSHWSRPAFSRTATRPATARSTPTSRSAPTPSVPRAGFGGTGRSVSTGS